MIYNSFLDFNSDNFLQIGTLQIKWYAVCILTGIILACVLGIREAKKFGISTNKVLDGVLICVPLAILGARLYYVFTSWSSFQRDTLIDTLFAIIGYENGQFQLAGLAINGGIIVAIIFVIVYCKVRKINVYHVFDLLAPGLLIGQICGRWGNFFNQEAHGPAVTSATEWITNLVPDFIMDRMYFYDASLGQKALWHPTFLYEAVWNLIALVIILVSRRKNKYHRVGDSVPFYLAWYGLGRALIIEPLRMDPLLFSKALGPDVLFNRVNVVINLALALIGIVWLVLKHTVFKEQYYSEAQKEVADKKIDGVIVRLDETLVTVTKLLENAYYYTSKEIRGVELYDSDLAELTKQKPEDYFQTEAELNYFNEYFYSHLNQIQTVLDCKEFFKILYKYDYKVAVVTNRDKAFAEYVLDALKITTYVSIIVDKDMSENPIEASFDAVKNAKNILVMTALASDVEAANRKEASSCLVYFGSEIEAAMEKEPTYVINKVTQLEDIIIE